MSNNVFVNGREISCKAAAGKTICAMPDVCFTPPENPATPPGVPIPYPNTGLASDTTGGSKNVKITDKEVGLKNKSSFKKSSGDEAGCAAKKGVITSKNTGKVYFNSWSMDVMIEGQNAVRHFDLTTNNHASVPGDTPTWPYIDNMFTYDVCRGDIAKEYAACKDFKPRNKAPNAPDPCDVVGDKPTGRCSADDMADRVVANDCLNARRCQLSPYRKTHKAKTCCNGQTAHHIVDKASFGQSECTDRFAEFENYNQGDAPCVCAEGTSHSIGGTHELMHVYTKAATLSAISVSGQAKTTMTTKKGTKVETNQQTYADARETGLDSFQNVFPDAGCDRECLLEQIDAYHMQVGIKDDSVIKATTTGPAQENMTVARANDIVASRSWIAWLVRFT